MKIGFGDCVFDPEARQVVRNGRPVPLSPKAFLLLDALLAARPKALSRAQIHERVWPATHVSESNLANLIVELRRALGDDADEPRYIRTLPRFGYAFRGDAAPLETDSRQAGSRGPLYRLIWGRREIALKSGVNLLGRDPDAVVWIDDESVSRRHARIVVGDGEVTIEDLGSKNGTRVGGRRIDRPTPLAEGDTLKIGPASMTLRILRRTGSTVSTMKSRAPR